MKKIFISAFVLAFSFFWVVNAYDLTSSDFNISDIITKKIERLITNKWESYRSKYTKALIKLKDKYNSERIKAILDDVVDKLNFSGSINHLRILNIDIFKKTLEIKIAFGALDNPWDYVISNEKYEWKEVYVWGNKLTIGKDYFVWTPNYIAFWLDSKNFIDPYGSEYILWITNNPQIKYQIYTKLENWVKKKNKIVWNYTPREVKKISVELVGIPGETTEIRIINPSDVGYIGWWDNTNLWKIITTSIDGLSIIFNQTVAYWADTVFLSNPDTKGLIFMDWNFIEDWTITE